MGYVISNEDFMIHILANLPEEYKSKAESLENDLDNKDDRPALDYMLVELDAKYEKIYKKNNYDLKNENEKKVKGRNNNHGTALQASGYGVFKGRVLLLQLVQKVTRLFLKSNKILIWIEASPSSSEDISS